MEVRAPLELAQERREKIGQAVPLWRFHPKWRTYFVCLTDGGLAIVHTKTGWGHLLSLLLPATITMFSLTLKTGLTLIKEVSPLAPGSHLCAHNRGQLEGDTPPLAACGHAVKFTNQGNVHFTLHSFNSLTMNYSLHLLLEKVLRAQLLVSPGGQIRAF